MARTELPNGVILPAEYSDDWYEDMTSNLTKLDDVIGSDSEKLNADGVYFLRMSSAALTDSGTGNFSDLNSSYKIKTGDLVLDSGRKLYRIVSVDSTNETFTVGNSLFKVTAESDLAPVAESGDYGDLDNRPDLNPYDQHLANTDIHVTAADKTKWNTGVTQAYVLRYSSTAITDNSTIAYSTLDNTDNIKVSDKIIDSDGKIFSVVSIDSANETVTVGSALIDLALDSGVMHLSGNETASGQKTFSDMSSFQGSYLGNEASANARSDLILESNRDTHGQSGIFLTKFRQNKAQGAMSGNDVAYLSFDCLENSVRTNNGLRINFLNFVDDIPQRFILWSGITERLLGAVGFPWSGVYATNYYYGNDNVEFSTKFVTTDTAQTVDGNKTFSKYITSGGSSTGDEYSNNARTNLWLMGTRDTEDVSGVLFDTFRQNTAQGTGGHLLGICIKENAVRYEGCRFAWSWDNNLNGYSFSFRPTSQGTNQAVAHNLGTSTDKWDTINGLNPGSLSLPDTSNSIDISGYITDLTGSTNTYTALADGYVSIRITGTAMRIAVSNGVESSCQRSSAGAVACYVPVVAGETVSIYAVGTSINNAVFRPCKGNV